MPERKADKPKKEQKEQKHPFLPKLSIHKWKPEREMMRSVDESMLRARGGAGREPDQWHKDYRYA